jgi:TonB-linked SusC/RagA family outer membrane protein
MKDVFKNQLKNLLLLGIMVFSSAALFAQQGTIKGTVTDADGNPIIGANIFIEGTTEGTVSDIDGKFTLPVSNIGAIQVSASFVGYLKETQSVTVTDGGTASIDFLLIEDLQQLSEVVVIGYGSIKKSDVTGAVATVRPEDLTQLSTISVQEAMQGRVAGVLVTSNTGAPGDGVKVRIRGVSTINNSDPLYVVDGFPISDISYINPSDIESMEVLKDASSTAIYGNRGANGVVLITTKKGKAAETTVSFDMYYGMLKNNKKIDLLNAMEFAEAKYLSFDNYADVRNNEALRLRGSGSPLDDTLQWVLNNNYTGTDWQDAVIRTGTVQNYSLSISGGTENYKYNISGNYFREDGIIKNAWYRRYLLRYNSQLKISKRVTGDIGLSYVNREQTNYDQDIYGQGILPPALYADPISRVYQEGTDQYGPVDISQTTNPVAAADRMKYNRTYSDQLVTNLGLNIEIIKGLTFDSRFGASIIYNRPKRYIPEYNIGSKDLSTQSSLDETHQRTSSWNNSNYFTYSRELSGHSFTLMAGQEWQYFDDFRTRVRTFDIPNDPNLYFATASPGATAASVNQEPSRDNRYEWQAALFSFYGRINYSYQGKYLLQANIRRDGSSKLTPEYRWGNFPSWSAGWNLKGENFMDNVDLISALKVRISWGKTGNEGSVTDVYSPYAQVSPGLYTLGQDGTQLEGQIQTVNPNDKLQWEIVKQWNYAVDFGFFNNKLTGTVDYFTKSTEGMIVIVPPPLFTGTNASAGNVGNMENKGIEISLNYRNSEHDLKYEIGGNITFLDHPMVTQLAEEGQEIFAGTAGKIRNINRTAAGEEMGYFYGYKTDGLLSQEDLDNYPELYPAGNLYFPGQLKLVDTNGDGVIDPLDKTNIGSANPDFMYAMNFNFEYKGFDLKLFFQGVYGNEMINTLNAWLLVPAEGNQNLSPEVLNSWTEENQNTTVPRLVQGNAIFNTYFNDYLVEDASYFRLKNLQLGYTLPNTLSEKIGMKNLRIYFSAENLLTITQYSGLDPEVGNFQYDSTIGRRNPLSQGLDDASYPIAKRFLFGLNVSF